MANLQWKTRRFIFPAAILLALFLTIRTQSQSVGQSQSWSNPISMGTGWFPDIASDLSGRLHLAWSYVAFPETSAIPPDPTLDLPQGYDTVLYRQSTDGGVTWTDANDVIARAQTGTGGRGSAVTRPALFIDKNGILHMTFEAALVYYTYVSSDQATLATAWAQPEQISVNQQGYFSRMVIDSRWVYHMFFTENSPSPNCPICYHLFYRQSTNYGMDWSIRTDISSFDTGAAKPQILVDHKENMHVVWESGQGGALGQVTDPTKVMYSASYDGGASWSFPTELNLPDKDGKNITIGEDANGDLVAVWLNMPDDTIYYRVSHTEGHTWLNPEQITGVLGGYSLYPARLDTYSMAADSQGNLHLIMIGRISGQQPNLDLLHLVWDGQSWSPPEVIKSFNGDVPEWPRAAILNGNELNVTWFVRPQDHIWDADPSYYTVWFSQRTLNVPALPTVEMFTLTPTQTRLMLPTLTPVGTPTPLSQAALLTPIMDSASQSIYTDMDEVKMILLALVPGVIIMLIVFWVSRMRRG